MEFDEIFEDFKKFGTYQKMIVYLVLLPAVVPCGFHAYNQIFMSARPNHWCIDAAGRQGNNFSIYDKLHNNETDNCVFNIDNATAGWKYGTNKKVSCKSGWIYDLSKYSSTIVTEWNLVCENDFYPTLALVLFGVGGLIGNYVIGNIQDAMGRKIAFFLCLLIESVFSIASAFATTYWMWAVLRFGVGFTVPALLESPFVLAVELVGPEDRTFCTILINIAYSMGLVILSGVFYLVRDWRKLTLATTLPFLLLFLYWWVMPESPRWLLAKGKFDECAKILNTMATVNNVELKPDYMENLKQKYMKEFKTDAKVRKKRYGVRDLFKYTNLRRETILITFIWFSNTAVYVGLSYYAPSVGSDEFFNFFLAGVVELPTYIFLWPAMEKIGRRWVLCISMAIGGSACFATFLTQNSEAITLVLYCLGKIGISSSFVVLPLLASEIYPTVVRGLGISFSSVVGQIGPIFIPLINYLGKDILVLPLVIMGLLLILGGGASLVLPETLNQNLPETLEEAELIGSKSNCSWIPALKKSRRKKTTEATAVSICLN